MVDSTGRTLVCSVLFLDIAEYSRKSVSEQLELKQTFNAALTRALEQVAPRDRVVLDTGDGAAVTFLGDPEDALFSAINFRDATRTLPVRLGINLGPVRLLRDVNNQINMIGDGINVAQRVMSFASPNQLLVSRSFYEVVSCLSRDYAKLFRHEGSRTDKHVREHEVYSIGGDVPTVRRVAETVSQLEPVGGWFARPGLLGFQRSALVAAPLLFAALVAAGVATRPKPELGAPQPAAALTSPERSAAPAAAPAPEPATEPASKPKPSAAPSAPAKTAADKPSTPPPAAAQLKLAIAPWGAVFVDGKRVGVSPPLRRLELTPGAHRIEIRNTNFPPHVQTVDLRPGGEALIRHRFH